MIPTFVTGLAFVLTYGGLAVGRWPGLRTDRAGIALVGAALILASGALSFHDAAHAIDWETLALLLGMMIVVAVLNIAGFFERVALGLLTPVQNPYALLAIVMGLSGLLSALLVNDVVCLALTPVVLAVTESKRLDARPHLIGLALASNLGSVATLTGNPQNMMIGGFSGISAARFTLQLAPVALVGLAIGYGFVALIERRHLTRRGSFELGPEQPTRRPSPTRQRLLVKSVAVVGLTVVGFFLGYPLAIVALSAGGVLLVDRFRMERVWESVDWGLLVMFAGLFVVVRAFTVHLLGHTGLTEMAAHVDPIWGLSGMSLILSNLVSNVPAVLLFQPIIQAMPVASHETAWLTLAVSSTLAGNLTLLGSVANLIVVEQAAQRGVRVSFFDYTRIGLPVTLVTVLIGAAWLALIRT